MIQILVTLIVVGVLLYIVQLIPMDATIKKIIWILVILFVCLWVLNMFVPLGGPFDFPARHRIDVR